MVVQHNIPAINSHRNLGINNTNLSKNLEKLSSGYRINRAADDAAGLAISEKMRAQITGLNRAVMNAQDGASLIQTAEGALQEVHSMLNRMVELATQSANGTIQASDRQKIEAETKALKEEIDRISESTNFNGIKLLDGSLSQSGITEISIDNLATTLSAPVAGSYELTVAPPTNSADGDVISYTVNLNDGQEISMNFTVEDDGTNARLISSTGNTYSFDTGALDAEAMANAIMGELKNDKAVNQKFTITQSAEVITFAAVEKGTKAPMLNGATMSSTTVDNAGVATTAYDAQGVVATINAQDAFKLAAPADFIVFDSSQSSTSAPQGSEEAATFSINGVQFAVALDSTSAEVLKNRGVNVYIASGDPPSDTDMENLAALINQKTGLNVQGDALGLTFRELPGSGKGLTMQVGETNDAWNKITVSVDDMSSTGLGISGISMATQDSANAALSAINAAIEKVSVNRGNLGALQNRLEYTINNLNVTSENMTAAESRIRDVDMAKEMMQFTKNNVLSQAAQAMLAQANMQPQNVLQLLR